jgi:hypothetical protein
MGVSRSVPTYLRTTPSITRSESRGIPSIATRPKSRNASTLVKGEVKKTAGVSSHTDSHILVCGVGAGAGLLYTVGGVRRYLDDTDTFKTFSRYQCSLRLFANPKKDQQVSTIYAKAEYSVGSRIKMVIAICSPTTKHDLAPDLERC